LNVPHSQRYFDWFHLGKFVGISALVGVGIPAAWVVIRLLTSTFDPAGQLLMLLLGVLSLYALAFPWAFLFPVLVSEHWYYFTFLNAVLVGLALGTVTARDRSRMRGA
jgi:hypothetical protein